MAKKPNPKPQPKKKRASRPAPLPVTVVDDDDQEDDDDDDAPALEENADLVRAANELSGQDSGAKVHVYKLEPKEQKGTCLPYPASEFSLERLFDDYGGGTYQITIRHAHGPIFKRGIETLVEKRPKPVATAVDVGQVRQQARSEVEQIMQPQLALMDRIVTGLLGRPGAPAVDPAASINTMLEGAERIAKLGNKRESGSDLAQLMSMMEFLEKLRGKSDKGGDSGIEIVRDLIGMIKDSKPVALAAPGGQPGQPTNGGGDGMNVLIKELFANYAGAFLRAAEVGTDAGVYAQVLCDQVPQKFYAVVVEQLTRPNWFEQLAQLDSRVLPHRAWIEELRTGFLQAINALEKPVAPAGASPST